jgi:hypothetical protein
MKGYGHGTVRRLPISDVTYLDTYGNNWRKNNQTPPLFLWSSAECRPPLFE